MGRTNKLPDIANLVVYLQQTGVPGWVHFYEV